MSNVGEKKGPIIQKIKSFIPHKVKVVLKKSIFSIPVLNQKVEAHSNQIQKLEQLITILQSDISYLDAESNLQLPYTGTIDISSKTNTYQLETYHLPFPDYKKWFLKPYIK